MPIRLIMFTVPVDVAANRAPGPLQRSPWPGSPEIKDEHDRREMTPAAWEGKPNPIVGRRKRKPEY